MNKTESKSSVNDLAIMGGRVLFERELHVGYPYIGNRDRFLERVNRILDSRRLANNGPYVVEFENKLAQMSQVKHCVALCNATAALELVIRALGLEGEVIVPSMTFVATAHVLAWLKIKPVFCDIDPESLCIDPQAVLKLITKKTTGIIGVHLFGRICDVRRLQDIADNHGLKLLYDAAHAIGCVQNGKVAGSFGNAEVFSFHATKIVNACEGGAVLTNDDGLAHQLRLMRNFGFSGLDNVVALGINAKMHEVSAAMGLSSLEGFPANVEVNKRNLQLYKKLLAGISGISLLDYEDQDKSNYQYAVIAINKDKTGLSRDELMTILRVENILVRRYFYPGCHRCVPHSILSGGVSLPVTEQLNEQLMQLPTGDTITPGDIEKICQLIAFCLRNSRNIKSKCILKSPLEDRDD